MYTQEDITVDDVIQWCRGTMGGDFSLTRLTEIMNGDYPLDKAIEDILSLMNSEEYSWRKENE